jgi:hypothetical protein
MADVRLFISTVTDEFRSYRDELRRVLSRPNVDIHVQEDFIPTGTETLDKLDTYIAECDAVIHLAGDMTGAWAAPTSLQSLRARYPDLAEVLPPLKPSLETGEPPLSYTQWEAYLAVYHGKPLVIALPEPGTPRDAKHRVEADRQASQRAHLARLRALGRYAEFTFGNSDQLAANILRSSILDLLATADRQQAARLKGPKKGSQLGAAAVFLVLAGLFSWASYSLVTERFFFLLYSLLSFAFCVAAVLTLRQYLKRKSGNRLQ